MRQRIGTYIYENNKYDVIWLGTSYCIELNGKEIECFAHSWDLTDYIENINVDINFKDKENI